LSSLDETVIQHGAEFNLGVHQYGYNHFNPNGHKYLREFDCEVISRTTYRVGGVILSKEKLMVLHEPRVLIRYTLLEAHSPTKLRFKPFLAFRNVNTLCVQNSSINTHYETTENGISVCLYQGFPCLFMQFSQKEEYVHLPDWYKGIEYFKEKERGYEYKEDLFVPGYFELPMKKGESVIFSAGIEPIAPAKLKKLWEDELTKRIHRTDMFACLKNSAIQFYNKVGDNDYILAGYPWFACRARDQFISLPGVTLAIGDVSYFEKVMRAAILEIGQFIENQDVENFHIKEMDAPDALLWFIWAVQQYAQKTSIKQAAEKYGETVNDILLFIKNGKHPYLVFQTASQLIETKESPYTLYRKGYLVEVNALWHNALKFRAEIATDVNDDYTASLFNYQAEIAKQSFLNLFWNGTYLNDYVFVDYKNQEVRPNQILAVSLPFPLLDKKQQKSVLDICTKELLTPKGLRTLSPKSGMYNPHCEGSEEERRLNYSNGVVRPSTIGAYAEAYLKVYKNSGISFLKRVMVGYEAEMRTLTIGTLSELFDGNPPYHGHGAMSFAMSVGEVLRSLVLLKEYEDSIN
ncbi:MAG: amylo-alpha-1,6-glucosidase, partial [Prevotellaceae bacterium]|nr:amylo-alpha-1,6-glucosidase [Prevotellaceae bacterium]